MEQEFSAQHRLLWLTAAPWLSCRGQKRAWLPRLAEEPDGGRCFFAFTYYNMHTGVASHWYSRPALPHFRDNFCWIYRSYIKMFRLAAWSDEQKTPWPGRLTDGTSGDGRPWGAKTETMNPTHMCGDEGSRVGQLVVSPHPEGEEDHGYQAYDGHQRVEQSAE